MNLERMLSVLMLALLVTCGRAPVVTESLRATARPNTPAPTTPAPAAIQPTLAAQPAAGTLVVYHKSGGIMGMDETLTVAADGTLTLSSRIGGSKSAQASPSALRRLTELLGSAEFAALPPLAETIGADLFVYEISVGGSAQPTVVTMDGVQNPAVLDQVLAELEQLCGQVRS